MIIKRTKQFKKQYKKLKKDHQALVDNTLILFEKDPTNPKLNNHDLKGGFKGIKSLNVAFDIRLLFKEEGNYTSVLFLQVGTHSQLY